MYHAFELFINYAHWLDLVDSAATGSTNISNYFCTLWPNNQRFELCTNIVSQSSSCRFFYFSLSLVVFNIIWQATIHTLRVNWLIDILLAWKGFLWGFSFHIHRFPFGKLQISILQIIIIFPFHKLQISILQIISNISISQKTDFYIANH